MFGVWNDAEYIADHFEISGMASALAMNVLKSPQAALAAALFGLRRNISGSILATYWHRKPVEAVRPVEAARGISQKGELNEPA